MRGVPHELASTRGTTGTTAAKINSCWSGLAQWVAQKGMSVKLDQRLQPPPQELVRQDAPIAGKSYPRSPNGPKADQLRVASRWRPRDVVGFKSRSPRPERSSHVLNERELVPLFEAPLPCGQARLRSVVSRRLY